MDRRITLPVGITAALVLGIGLSTLVPTRMTAIEAPAWQDGIPQHEIVQRKGYYQVTESPPIDVDPAYSASIDDEYEEALFAHDALTASYGDDFALDVPSYYPVEYEIDIAPVPAHTEYSERNRVSQSRNDGPHRATSSSTPVQQAAPVSRPSPPDSRRSDLTSTIY